MADNFGGLNHGDIQKCFAAFAQRKTYICQAELLAYLCAYLTFPDLLKGHLIHHFGDNMAAISGVVKGGSSLPDSARLIHAIHLQVLRLRCYPWFGFVYSEDNVQTCRRVWTSSLCAGSVPSSAGASSPPSSTGRPRLASSRGSVPAAT